jgi:hypothetical protein
VDVESYVTTAVPIDTALVTVATRSEWVLDGACSRHVTGNSRLLHNTYKLNPPIRFITANGESISKLAGTATVNVGGTIIVLNDVAYVPNFSVNLISVAKIVDRGASVTYGLTRATVKRNGLVKYTVPRRNDLYIVQSTPDSLSSSATGSGGGGENRQQ